MSNLIPILTLLLNVFTDTGLCFFTGVKSVLRFYTNYLSKIFQIENLRMLFC